jgi:hypothetical protein
VDRLREKLGQTGTVMAMAIEAAEVIPTRRRSKIIDI